MATILIVDDQPANRELLVTLLRYGGHRLLESADGAAGLSIARSERPDLIITDIVMPVMDGYELARTHFKTRHAALVDWGLWHGAN